MANILKNQSLSPQKYIQTKAKDLPYYACYASEGWFESYELVSVIIGKQMPSGNICMGMYLLDKGCLGLKNTSFRFNFSVYEFGSFIENIFQNEGRDYEEIRVEDAHNLIFGAIDYAEELGFKPEKDWIITKYLLNEDLITDQIDDIPFGKDGKPFYLAGPYDNVSQVLATLRRKVGDGNFDFNSPLM